VAKKRNKSDLSRGPFTASDVKRALKLDAWTKDSGGGHQEVYEHPTKRGKIPVSEKWTAVRASDPIFNGLCRTMGVSKDELLWLLNGQEPPD
jgi:hypothetical protein